MGSAKVETRYRCSDDCMIEGCPSHVMTIEYLSVANSYIVQFVKGGPVEAFDSSTLEALIISLSKLDKMRADTIKLTELTEAR